MIIREGINVPYGCAIDGNDNLFVSNAGGFDITKYKRGKTEPTVVLDQTNGLTAPTVIALDASGDLYVANNDFGGHVANVQIFPPGAKKPSMTITNGAWWPQGIAVDSKGNLYVANFETSSKPGAVTEYLAGQNAPYQTILDAGSYPWGVTVDPRGRLFVSGGDPSEVGYVREFPPGSVHPAKQTITQDLIQPAGMAHWRPVLP